MEKEEPKQREMSLMNATTVIDTRKSKQETFVNEKCFKCGKSQYSSRKPFCTDDFCNKNFYQKPKQETLEEAAEKYVGYSKDRYDGDDWVKYNSFIQGAKWKQNRSYSEEEVLTILYKHTEDLLAGKKVTLKEWFEQLKRNK